MAQSFKTFREARAITGKSVPGKSISELSDWVKENGGVSVDSTEPPAPPPPKFCLTCKHVDKLKDDYDFMCRSENVAGISLVTGSQIRTLAWLARSDGGKCGKSAKHYEQAPPKVEAANPGGQTQVPAPFDAPASIPDVLPPI